MRTLRAFSRILIGIVFIFSGFVKAVDPLGSTYKFTDYFNAFNLGFLGFLALPLAIILSSTELIIGIAMLLKYRMKFFSFLLMIFMVFFTLLTFILALTNPVTDCGCFGDALILTNWATFWKNIVLMVFTVIIFLYRKKFTVLRTPLTEWSVISLFLLSGILLSLWNYKHLPLIDFRPYSVGTHLPSAMEIPEGAPTAEYNTILKYRNIETGDVTEFTIENFPRDSTWEFVDSESVLISKGYEPPVHDFQIANMDNDDVTSGILYSKDYSLLLVAHDINTADKEALAYAENYFNMSLIAEDLDFYAITASPSDKISSVKASLDLSYDMYLADEIMLKTTVRSNPGLILIKEGTIIAKWAYPDFPQINDLASVSSAGEVFLPLVLSKYRYLIEKRIIYVFILGFLVTVFLIRTVLDRRKLTSDV